MPARYQLLASWINRYGWKRGAELGVFAGVTHFHLLNNCPTLDLLIGVDVWDIPGFKEGRTKSGERCACPYCDETRASRRAETVTQMRERVASQSAAYAGRSRIEFCTTTAAARHVEDGSLDFVFIDGDHSTEGVSADIRAWRPKIKTGGRLIGHDWNMASVRNGVAFTLGASAVIMTADDHVWVFRC